MKLRSWLGAAALLALAAFPATAQQVKTAEGLVINLGIMSAEKAVHADGHREAHPHKFPSGSQHLLITLTDEKTGARIGNAEVVIEVVDPKGRAAKKPLLHTSAAGMPDYSELFVFGWSGRYTVKVDVTQGRSAKPVKTTFTVQHNL